jgi:stage II sporulation protein D
MRKKHIENIWLWVVGVCAIWAIPYIITQIFCYKTNGQLDMQSLTSDKDVCIYQEGSYKLIDCEEYIVYCLSGMADMSWNDEMLKTMAVLLRTAIYYEMNTEADTGNGGGKIINEADLVEIRYEPEELYEKWGDKYRKNMTRIYDAVKETTGQVITYEDSLIIPVYHVISTGKTVSAEEIYGTDIPYLVSVDSSQDTSSPDFSSTQIVSELRIKKECDWQSAEYYRSEDADGDISDDVNDGENNTNNNSYVNVDKATINVVDATESGFVKYVNVFGKIYDGEAFAQHMSLSSTNFHIDEVENGYRIITIGQGNSLGLSLYGAESLAESGYSYIDILKHYYTGVSIK